MTAYELRQFSSLLKEIQEDTRRAQLYAAYSLFGEGEDALLGRHRQIEEISGWITKIEDSATRRAFKLRYIDGLPWAAVSARLGYGNESGARMLCLRYLQQ